MGFLSWIRKKSSTIKKALDNSPACENATPATDAREKLTVAFKNNEEPPEGIELPQKLMSKIPSLDRIEIVSFSNDEYQFGTRYYLGRNYTYGTEQGDFIQYDASVETLRLPYEERKKALTRLFADAYHPFFSRFTDNIEKFAEILKSDWDCVYRYEVTENELCVQPSGDGFSFYRETPTYFSYESRCSESYHDGGGSYSSKWYICAADGVKCKAKLTRKVENKDCSALSKKGYLPECRGFWVEDEHVYVVDPWGLPGIFEYYYRADEKYTWDSEEEIWEIGVPIESEKETKQVAKQSNKKKKIIVEPVEKPEEPEEKTEVETPKKVENQKHNSEQENNVQTEDKKEPAAEEKEVIAEENEPAAEEKAPEKKEDDYPPKIMMPLYKKKLANFYEAHKHEFQDDEYELLVRQFARHARILDISHWWSDEDRIIASHGSNTLVFHDESVTEFSSRYLKLYTGDLPDLTWETESDWPCAEQAVLTDMHVHKGNPWCYKNEDCYEVLLRGLCHMSGIWLAGRYDMSER